MNFNHNIRREVTNQNLFRLLDSYVNNENEQQYRDSYFGVVINNQDSDKLGRCQIRVYTLFSDNIKDDELPWALPEFSFIGSTIGSFIVPPINTIVMVHFDHGDIYNPIYSS